MTCIEGRHFHLRMTSARLALYYYTPASLAASLLYHFDFTNDKGYNLHQLVCARDFGGSYSARCISQHKNDPKVVVDLVIELIHCGALISMLRGGTFTCDEVGGQTNEGNVWTK